MSHGGGGGGGGGNCGGGGGGGDNDDDDDDFTCKIVAKPWSRALNVQGDHTIHFTYEFKPNNVRKRNQCDLMVQPHQSRAMQW